MSIRPSTKAKRAHDKAAEWLKAQGISVDAIQAAQENVVQTREEVSFEAEAVLAFLEKPTRFITYKCKRCGDSFGTNYRYNRYCSDTCRAKSLRDMGIEWDQHADIKQRWGGEPPLTIPANAIESLLSAAQYIQEQLVAQGLDSAKTPTPQSQTGSQFSVDSGPLPVVPTSTPESRSEVPAPRPDHPQSKTSGAHTIPDFSLPELTGL